ncbi:tetratricopeptide repeat protein [Cryptosporangium phraense]|uniref:Tetratricopeptide repeat protein n=1 Tax=Cryptosporangium phraense TaxID=2593070 RepID=A0A545AZZ0_9ACTN|nr:tetratricopeptide repeat protein [Cryptosporangium phraense]TQS46903.1 tetratricopeptide repeat protein [Cryptosporangium phraense]
MEAKSDRGVSGQKEMYTSALHADVYIADLTGANPNVYLELGVRWALRDRVTIIVCQSITEDLRFNVQTAKAIRYGKEPGVLKTARQRVVDKIIQTQRDDEIDSLIRVLIPDLYTTSRADVDRLRSRIRELEEERGEELVEAALAPDTPQDQGRRFLEEAITKSPRNFRAHLALGDLHRREGRFGLAIERLDQATRLQPGSAEAWRLLGVALTKAERLDEARTAFERSLDLDPHHSETWSNLGGRRRRAAMRPDGSIDRAMLREARDAYLRASRIDRADSYPLGNAALISLMLSTTDPALAEAANTEFTRLFHVATAEVVDPERTDEWKLLDLATALAYRGRLAEGEQRLAEAAALVPRPELPDRFGAFVRTLSDVIAVLPDDHPHRDAFVRLAGAGRAAMGA